MIHYVKLGTQEIDIIMYTINMCGLLTGFFFNTILNSVNFQRTSSLKSINMGVGRGVVMGVDQMVQPVMIVTLTNFEGLTTHQF